MMSDSALNDFLRELRQATSGELRADEVYRTLYSTDASIYQVMPRAVFLPQNTQEAQTAVRLAAKYKIPLVPRGGGTSLAGQAVNDAVIVDTSRHFDQILGVNPDEKWVRAQVGVTLAALNAHLKPYGLKYGPDPASGNRAVLGGMVGNNSSGSHSILYGMTADHLLAAQVILWDGTLTEFAPKAPAELEAYQRQNGTEAEIYQKMQALLHNPQNLQTIRAATPAHWRRCGGYNLERLTDGEGFSFRWQYDPRFNLAKLICGAEGTLGLVTEVTLNLVELPQRTALAILHFDELPAALNAVPTILQVSPTAVELLDYYGLTLVQNAPLYAEMMDTFLQGKPNCILITEFYGETRAELEGKLSGLAAHLQTQDVPVRAITNLLEPAAIQTAWKVREASFGILMNMRGDVKPLAIADDSAVPPEHLAEYITQLETYCKTDLNHEIAYFAHASAGCLHVHSLLNAKLAEDVAKLPHIMQYAGDLLRRYGGVLSSEHGDGRLRSWLNPHFYGEDMYALFQQVKGIFDPHNLFNPGNIVDAPAMTEHLRYGADYHALPLTPFLDFSSDQGFDRAIEMCNGSAVCRQLTGSMCPTFKATRNEQHSTRGRANALRAALSGRLNFSDPGVYETLDICVSCKACKTECPSSVDMAKLKAEYLHQYYQTHFLPLRSRFFAHVEDLSKLAAGWLAPLANFSLQLPPLRGLLNRLLRLAPQRPLPTFARQTFDSWFKKQPAPSAQPRPVILLVDVVHNYNDPQVAQDALRVLQACGFSVRVPPMHDLGRPAFSKGDLPLAKSRAQAALAWLAPHAQAGIPLIALEPSDVSMLRQDYLSLLPGDETAQKVAAQTYSLEEWLWNEMKAGRLEGVFQPQSGKILLHGHCHQKAGWGTRQTEELLAFLGYEVQEAGSACCGMAGSFGYEAEHYPLSLQMAELTLLPAVRAQSADTLIVTTGVSCHEQVQHGTDRNSLHPAQALARALR